MEQLEETDKDTILGEKAILEMRSAIIVLEKALQRRQLEPQGHSASLYVGQRLRE